MKILILASNPRKDLNLDREIRDLTDVIEKSRNRQEFEVESALAVRVGELQDLLFKHRPQIVHFCGHGSGQQGLVFESNNEGEQWVRAEALSDLFRLFSTNVGCVLLNACYSEEQADAIVNHIDYVIGMNQEIRDDAAIAFSKGFYRALGYECSIEQAYEFGKNAIQLEISGSSKMRSVATEEVARKAEVVGAIQHTDTPEHLKPILKMKLTLTPSARANITTPEQPIHQETRVAIQLDIDKSLEADAKVKQYRDRVREFLSDRKLSALETIRLERLRKDLGLSEAEGKRILAEEQEPFRQAQDEYEAMLIGLIEAGHYPLDAAMQEELQSVRQELGLTNEEVEAIATPILAAADEDYQARLAREQQQEYEQKLQRYEQEFSNALATQYPIEEAVRAGMTSFHQSLGLRDEDATRIEHLLIAPMEAEYQRQQEEQRQQKRELEEERQREQQAQQEYEQKLRRYEQEFSRAVQVEYPLRQYVSDGLKSFRQQLGVKEEDAARFEEVKCQEKILEQDKNKEYEQQSREQNASTLNDSGVELYNQGKLEESMEAYYKAILLNPNLALAYSNIGIVLRDQENFSGAVQQCREAILIDPSLAIAHYNLGSALFCQSKWVEAIAAVEQAVNLDPDGADCQVFLETLLLSDLENFLRSSDWNAANQLTWSKLHTLSQPNDNEGNILALGTMSPEALEMIPFEYIMLLDHLWQKYSDNRFGFSPQKTKFLSVGCDANKFAEIVGWRGKAGLLGGAFAWKTFDSLDFSLNAPEGCFPMDINFFLRGEELLQEPFWAKMDTWDT